MHKKVSFTVQIFMELSVHCNIWSSYLEELRKSLIDEDEGDEESKNLLGEG